MKIKVAILEQDQIYLNRIVLAFNTKYSDKIEVYSFTNKEYALSVLDNSRIDVFIASDIYDIDVNLIPKRCGFAYFVDSTDIDTLNGQYVICKFQKADLIYKQILSIYSECSSNISGHKLDGDSSNIIIFSSPNGGVGTSSIAAACAMYFAQHKKKTLYLNLEKYGAADLFFDADGSFDMSDLIYALKTKKANFSMKLESYVKQDAHGVYFYSKPKVALDMFELDSEDILRLISELRLVGSYDYIIIDMDFSIDKDVLKIYKQSNAMVWVGDGSDVSNYKIQQAYTAVSIIEKNEEYSLLNRLCLIYNKFSNKTGKTISENGMKKIGGAPVYIHTHTRQIVEQLATLDMFGTII